MNCHPTMTEIIVSEFPGPGGFEVKGLLGGPFDLVSRVSKVGYGGS